MSGKKPMVLILDDDEASTECLEIVVRDLVPNAQITSYEYMVDAIEHPGTVDIIIIDISSLGDIRMAHAAYAPICSFVDRHPGATVVINSAVSLNTMLDVRDDVLEHCPDALVRVASMWNDEAPDLEHHLRELM